MGEATAAPRAPADESAGRDTIGRLAERGEQTLHRLADLPGGRRVLDGMNELRDAVGELNRRVRGIDELERRLAALEAEVAELRSTQPSQPVV